MVRVVMLGRRKSLSEDEVLERIVNDFIYL